MRWSQFVRNVDWRLVRTVAPTLEPLTESELRQQINYSDDDTDELIRGYISAAREMFEVDTERALLSQTWTLKLNEFPDDHIELRLCPLGSVSSITYTDSDGASQTLATTVYLVSNSDPARITLKYGQVWPATYDQADAITVTFTAGYSSELLVPAKAKQAIRMLAGHWYQNREAIGQVGSEIALGYESLVNSMRWGGYR